jgi:Ca-activated chloride channel family protein
MERFRFEHPEALYLLFVLIPLAAIFFWFMLYRKKALQRFAEGSLLRHLMPEKPSYKHQVKFILGSLALVFLLIALANPQYSLKKETVKRQGIDLMIAVDISRSMMAEDEKPNRLERARQVVSRLVDELGGDRVGLILFAGNAYLQVPITTDYTAVKTFIKTISTDLAPSQGTAIGEAIEMAEKAFASGQTQFKSILIISDGEDHEGAALEAAEKAAANGTVIHTLGIGSPQGSPIPIRVNGRSDLKRDRNGSIVFSKLNEDMLAEVAQAGNGRYFKLESGLGGVSAIRSALAGMDKQEFEDHVFTDFEDNFQIFLAIALALLVIEYLVSERKSAWLSDWKIFKV